MTVLLVAESREGWEHVSVLAEHLSAHTECVVLRDASLPNIHGIENLQTKDALESPDKLFQEKNVGDVIVITQRQGIGPLTQRVLGSSESARTLTVIQDYWVTLSMPRCPSEELFDISSATSLPHSSRRISWVMQTSISLVVLDTHYSKNTV
jgi:hypothetical protein